MHKVSKFLFTCFGFSIGRLHFLQFFNAIPECNANKELEGAGHDMMHVKSYEFRVDLLRVFVEAISSTVVFHRHFRT
jgi:hypothetical protein